MASKLSMFFAELKRRKVYQVGVVYLIVVWGLVIAMARREWAVAPSDLRVARLIRWAFTFLALGDTGHVGFRVLAFAQGDLEATVSLLGREFGLVGLGALGADAGQQLHQGVAAGDGDLALDGRGGRLGLGEAGSPPMWQDLWLLLFYGVYISVSFLPPYWVWSMQASGVRME